MNQITDSSVVELVRHGDEIAFNVPGLTLCGKTWGNPQGLPVLALHGWLDNANSFDRLAPYLPEFNLVALDFAGHGRSEHRQPGVHYQSISDVQDVLAVADELGWEQFGLLGHSMGASVASELSGLFPERVSRAVMIDGFLATGGLTLAEQRSQNREALAKMLSAQAKQPRVYPDVATMVRRVTAATDQSEAAARVLVARGHMPVEGGVTWRTDPRIRFPSPVRMCTTQIDALISQADVPSLLLVAADGDKWYQDEIDARAQRHPSLTVKKLPGPHHIHLEPAHAANVVREIRGFFALD